MNVHTPSLFKVCKASVCRWEEGGECKWGEGRGCRWEEEGECKWGEGGGCRWGEGRV